MFAWSLLTQLCITSSALRSKHTNHADMNTGSYTFDAFLKDFGRHYEQGTSEFLQRRTIFDESMAQILAINAREGRSWSAGVHPFMDWTTEERQGLRGYQLSHTRHQLSRKGSVSPFAAMQVSTTVYGGLGDSVVVSTPPVRQQGVCGSCWAIAATEAVEALIMKHGGDARPSVEALLECVDNSQHCGGSGGCGGATPELAFGYMAESGVPTEEDLPYKSGNAGNCRNDGTSYPADWSRIYINGFSTLPSNKAQPLMQALVEQGPVVISADSSGWTHYQSGIYDGCSKDAIIDHTLLAKGYGEADQKFWLLQNSWGQQWGEQGLLRLLRHDDEDGWCGTDSKPHMGGACEGQTEPYTVCGSCGLLFDSLIAYGARVDMPQQKKVSQAEAPQVVDVPSQAIGDGFALDNKTQASIERMKHLYTSVEKTSDPGDKAEDYFANFARGDAATRTQQNNFLRAAIAQDSSSHTDPQPDPQPDPRLDALSVLASHAVETTLNQPDLQSEPRTQFGDSATDDASDIAEDVTTGGQNPALDEDVRLLGGNLKQLNKQFGL